MNKRLIFNKGGSIVEMIVAFAILSLAITAVILVSFGNQDTAVGSELNNKALYIAEELIENAYADSISNFAGLGDLFAPASPGELFDKELIVTPIGSGQCAKRIEAKISWSQGPAGAQNTSLTNVFTDVEASQAVGGDCPTEDASDWENPDDIFISNSVMQGIKANGIDVNQEYVYLTTNPNTKNKEDFFVYQFNPATETTTFKKAIDVAPNDQTGLMAVDVAGNYAYVIRQSDTAQFMVIDITTPSNPTLKWSVDLPTTNPAKPAKPSSIYFYDDKVFIGALNDAATKELFVFDVEDVASSIPILEDSLELPNRDVHDLVVLGDYAYLATTHDSQELTVINISDPLVLSGSLGYNASGNNDGTAVTLFDGNLYLGRAQNTPAAAHDMFIIDAGATQSAPVTNGLATSTDLALSNNALVTGIVVLGAGEHSIAFFGLDDPNYGMQIWDVTDPVTMHLNSKCGDPNFSENATGIDVEGNYVFTSSKSAAELQIFLDLETECPL